MRRILIVDDDETLSDITADMLMAYKYEVERCFSADEAFEILTDKRFDLIILDINLPDGTGFSVCQELRNASDVPVIFASARTSVDDRITGFEMGGDDYIPKAVSLSLKEFDLLAYLCRNMGEAVQKDKLISEVWGAFSEVDASTLTVHIRWLREKLEDDPSKPLHIKTVFKV